MITGDSRYVNAAHESAASYTYDEFGMLEADPKDKSKANVINRETTYLLTTAYTTPPPKSYMVRETDSFQLLASYALQDPSKWWIIANANPHIRYPFDIKAGDMIYLPE